MVSKQTIIRNKLQSKVFTPYGKSVTFINKSSLTYNSRGEETGYTPNNSTVTVVPYNLVDSNNSHEPFGELNAGESDFAVPYDTVVSVGTEFTMEGTVYIVKEVQLNYLPDNVVTIIRAVKQEA